MAVEELGKPVTSLAKEADRIIGALDDLLLRASAQNSSPCADDPRFLRGVGVLVVGSLLQLAQLAHQREVQRRFHGLGAEAAGECHVAFELGAIAIELAIQEFLQARAFVAARLEVDDPADALGIDEGAVDHDAGELTVRDARQRELAACFAMRGRKYPAAVAVVERAHEAWITVRTARSTSVAGTPRRWS